MQVCLVKVPLQWLILKRTIVYILKKRNYLSQLDQTELFENLILIILVFEGWILPILRMRRTGRKYLGLVKRQVSIKLSILLETEGIMKMENLRLSLDGVLKLILQNLLLLTILILPVFGITLCIEQQMEQSIL